MGESCKKKCDDARATLFNARLLATAGPAARSVQDPLLALDAKGSKAIVMVANSCTLNAATMAFSTAITGANPG